MTKTLDAFRADAEWVYERARDEGKAIAVLTIAGALLDAYAEGADEVFAQHQLLVTPAVSESEM